MGIQGLLPQLKSIMLPIHVKDLKGCSVAVDTYSWLHKGALSCSKDLCKGIPTTKHIDYCMHRVNLLRHYGVKPILVFDGGPLPMKNKQEIKRARSRKESLSRAIEHESNGNMTAAYECYQKAVDISPSVAHDLIQVLKQENVYYVVAPYEADAQMTFLAISKHVDAVITEDSDLIAFGCPRIIYKMDKFGQGIEFRYSKLEKNKELDLKGFTKQMILEMCILSGCDYLPSLPGMGLKKAHSLIKKFKSYDKVIKHLRYNTAAVSPLYEESFKKAIMTFIHQRVYDHVAEDLVHLSHLSDCTSQDLDFLGPVIPTEIAQGIAKGDIDPFTMMLFQKGCNAAELAHNRTYELDGFKVKSEKRKLDLPAQKNLLTNYLCTASLEAKQKFRAPRSSPVHPNLEAGASSPWAKGDDPLSVHVDDDIPPCLESTNQGLVEHIEITNDECASEVSESKTRTGKRNVIVRSAYFLKNNKKEDNQDDKNDCGSTSDAIDGTVESIVKNSTARSSYFQHKPPAGNGETEQKETENTRVIVRSCYFQKNLANENCHDVASELQHTNPNSSSNDCHEERLKKRKFSFFDTVQTENVHSEDLDVGSSGNQGVSLSGPEDLTNDGEAKFGSNISHLATYSQIAEESIENFVSVISSFRFTSNGSRASGLRAPLKDIKNTSSNSRSGDGMDLSKFVYKPTKKKQLSARRKA